MITFSEIEQLRSPSELLDFVNQIKTAVQADKTEKHLGIQKIKLYKEFLDELVPLSCFARLKYDDSFKVRLVLGNQPYDAIV